MKNPNTVSAPFSYHTHTHTKESQEKAASFNTSSSSEREAAWSHESGSWVCVETKWMAAGWNCATVRLGIRAPMACGGTSRAKQGIDDMGADSLRPPYQSTREWGEIRCTSFLVLVVFFMCSHRTDAPDALKVVFAASWWSNFCAVRFPNF